MQTRPLGKSGIEASVVAFGAWAIGGWMWGGVADEKDSIAAIHAALDNGMNLIDTAPMYGFGHSEEVVGKALKGAYRQKAIIATKFGLVWDGSGEDGTFQFFAGEKGRVTDEKDSKYKVFRNTKAHLIRRDVELSLKRLQTDVIDLYQSHWQDKTTPIEETMNELMKLKKEGKIRAIGCSNATPEQMAEYCAAGQLDTDQEKYSMLDRGMETTNLPFCKENDIAFLAYSPMGQGLLTGAVGPDRVFEPGDNRNTLPRFSKENRVKVAEFLAGIKPLADELHLTLGQLVVAWTIQQPGCSHALLGARNAKQVEENAKAGTVKLEDSVVAQITRAVNEKLVGV